MARVLNTFKSTKIHVLTNSAGTVYTIPVRVRLRASLKNYSGGTLVRDYVRKDATVPTDNNEVVKLTVSNPPAVYYLNDAKNDMVPDACVYLDYMLNIQANGNATLTLELDSIDGKCPENVVLGEDSVNNPGEDEFDDFGGVFCQLDFSTTYETATVEITTGGGVNGFKFSAFAEDVTNAGAEK